MAPSSAGVLAALKRAREEKVKEFNALIFVAEKLLRAIEDVERNLNGTLEKKVRKPIISRLHSFLIQSTMTQEGPTLPPFLPRNSSERSQIPQNLLEPSPDQHRPKAIPPRFTRALHAPMPRQQPTGAYPQSLRPYDPGQPRPHPGAI